jgi:hypothetical protein
MPTKEHWCERAFNPDPKFVKWFNPDIPRGQERDKGEGGGIFALDRGNGQFFRATPFAFDTPEFLISNIDGRTGKTTINWDVVLKQPGDQHLICYWNTRSFWPTAYHLSTNSLYVPYCSLYRQLPRHDRRRIGPSGTARRQIPARRGSE